MLTVQNKRLFLQIGRIFCVALSLTACEKIHAVSQKIQHRFFQPENTEQSQSIDEKSVPPQAIPMVNGVKVNREISYGSHPKQRMDVYAPLQASNAPVIMMLHGGGWSGGDKGDEIIYMQKVNRWVPKGFIVISVNTRLLPEADVYGQIEDFTQAVVTAQQQAETWGGNSEQFILMGHSSGGTIVSVISAKPSLVSDLGGKRWLATFSIDSSSLDIERTMRLWHPEMFKGAYGNDAKKWTSASPFALISQASIPMFIACSTFRPDSSCEQAQLFKDKAQTFNMRVEISPQKMNHGDINDHLGIVSDNASAEYTNRVEHFMASLDANLAKRLLPLH